MYYEVIWFYELNSFRSKNKWPRTFGTLLFPAHCHADGPSKRSRTGIAFETLGQTILPIFGNITALKQVVGNSMSSSYRASPC